MADSRKKFFHYDEKTDREWFEIELSTQAPYSRATIQDYARCMDRSPRDWVYDALVWFMQECDRQGVHGAPPTSACKAETRPPVPAWRVRLSEFFYGLAMKLDGSENDDNRAG